MGYLRGELRGARRVVHAGRFAKLDESLVIR
jgi:hypothetical protein